MSHPTPTTAQPTQRFTALDGLRGIAALVVVFMHIFNLNQPFLPTNVQILIDRTPFAFLVAGRESVAVFFVLSGFVVALPVLVRGKEFKWINYYVSRVLRLFLPTAASILLAACLIILIPRTGLPHMLANQWIDKSEHTFTISSFINQFLFFPANGNFPMNVVLWSLRWEMFFSLLLPLFVGICWVLQKYWYLIFVLSAVMVWYGLSSGQDETPYQFFATFALGTLIAVKRESLARVAHKVFTTPLRRWVLGGALLVFSVFLLTCYHFVPVDGQVYQNRLLLSLYPIGAAGIVLAALYFSAFKTFLNTRFAQFLGKISFSLYLVHVPIIVSAAYLFGFNNWLVTSVAAPIVAIGVAMLFQKFVEAPSHRFAKWSGKHVDAKIRSRVAVRKADVAGGNLPFS